MLKLIYVLPQCEARELVVSDQDTLATLQALVGGSITGVSLDDNKGGSIDGFVHDEGLLIGLPPNTLYEETGSFLAGPIVFSRTSDDGNTISVRPGDLAIVNDWLKKCKRPGRFDYGY